MTYPVRATLTLGRRRVTLSTRAGRLADASRREATWTLYRRALRRYDNWATEARRDPWEPATFAEYIAELHARGRGRATIAQATTVVRLAFAAAGLPSPTAERDVADVVRGAQREAVRANPPRAALALGLDDWRAACRALYAAPGDVARRDRALLVIGYLALLRRSELAALCVDDVTVYGAHLDVRVRLSKRSDLPQHVLLPAGSDPATCPVRAWQDWQDVAPSTLFGAESTTPAWCATHGRGRAVLGAERLGDAALTRVLRHALHLARVPEAERYSAHSLRAGAASALANAGASLPAIMGAGRWTDAQTAAGYATRGTALAATPLHRLRY